MHLALDRARADCTPGDQIRVVLPKYGVEKLGGRRQAQLGDIQKQSPGQPKSLADLVAAVESGIIDQTLPTDRRKRLVQRHTIRPLTDSLASLSCA